MKNMDRLFIDKFDNFIFTVRKIVYFGNTSSKLQPADPKHDRLRFINYFSDTSDIYNADEKSIDFSIDNNLKDSFADLYTYRAMSTSEMGDSLQLFSKLSSEEFQTVNQLIAESARNPKNFNRRIEQKSELAKSGAIIIKNTKPKQYKKNIDICNGLKKEEKQQFLNALDFAIKKTNFSSLASTYKKLFSYSNGYEPDKSFVSIDHQLFHPILDEFHLWTALSAITEALSLSVEYCPNNLDSTQTLTIDEVYPLRIVYDNLYGRGYLFVYEVTSNKIFPIRLDRVYHMEIKNETNSELINEKRQFLNKKLETAWLVSINEGTEKVKLRFDTEDYTVKHRVENEGHHGVITEQNDNYFFYEIEVNDPTELTNWILSFGEYCRVIKPQSLVQTVINHLEGVVNDF